MNLIAKKIDDFVIQNYINLSNNIEKVGGGTAVVSGGVGCTKWLEENNAWISSVGVIFGIVLGIAGYFTNLYFLRKKDRMESQKRDEMED